MAHPIGECTVAFTTSEGKRWDALDLGADEVVICRDAEDRAKHARSFNFIFGTDGASHNLDAYTALLNLDGM